MNGVQTRFKCKLDVKRCKRFVFPPSSLLPRSNALKTKAIRYFQTDRTLTRIVSPPLTDEVRTIGLDGIFVQIGLAANSGAFREVVDTNRPGEIVIDSHCRTSVPGIYAAGDVSTVPYKQIIISMGEGAKAALTAFEDRMRGIV